MSSEIVTRKFLVSGRVQGVYFRASTREQALRLGLRGYAKNLPDGRVEVLATGAARQLDELEQWLWRGPVTAQVKEVLREDAPEPVQQEHTGFVAL